MDVYRPEEAFDINLRTFKLFGIWPSSVKHPVLRIFYKTYCYIIHLLYIVALCSTQFVHMYHIRKDLKELVDGSFFTMSCVGYTTKLVVFLLRRKEVEEFFERLHDPIFAPKRKEHFDVLKESTLTARKSSWTYFSLTMVTVTTWIFVPLLDSKQFQDKTLLYTAWYPYNTTLNPGYGCTYAFQTFFLLTTAIMNTMMDMMTTNFYVVMVGQMEILKLEFRQLTDFIALHNRKDMTIQVTENETKIYDNLGSDQDEVNCFQRQSSTSFQGSEATISHNLFSRSIGSTENTSNCNDLLLDEVLNKRIIRCTLRYQAVLKFVKDVTNLFQIGIVTQVFISSITICTTTYEMSIISPATMQFYVFLQYQLCILFQIFIYSWRGNDISLKATELKDAVYECGWIYIPNVKFRKSLCIIMSPLQVPLTICVGKFFPLSVDTFFKIIKVAYTFYVLLKQVNAKRQ